MNKPFFSIIMTVYNGSSTLLESINSIFNQKYSNFELIVFNDGSTDNSHELLIHLCSKYSFTYKSYSKTGRVNLLNLGIEIAIGNYICICDCDDIWHPNKLQFQHSFFMHNDNATFVCTKTKRFTNKFTFDNYTEFTFHKISNYKFYLFNPICHSSIAFKRSYFRYCNQVIHDYKLYFDFINSKQDLFMLNQKLTFNRIHKNQNFQTKGFQYFLKSQNIILSQIVLKKNYYFLVLLFLKYLYYPFGLLRRLILSNRIYFLIIG
jgi:glycosyltransferase involved in cell wall biosynthesis